MSDYQEMDYWMSEDLSDVVFIIDNKPLPAIKTVLITKNKVFRAKFSGEFKQTNEEGIVIKDTTYSAFETLIRFLIMDLLVLKDVNDLQLIDEVLQLCHSYDCKQLMVKIVGHLKSIDITFENLELFTSIAANHELNELLPQIHSFIEQNFVSKVKKSDSHLISFKLCEQLVLKEDDETAGAPSHTLVRAAPKEQVEPTPNKVSTPQKAKKKVQAKGSPYAKSLATSYQMDTIASLIRRMP